MPIDLTKPVPITGGLVQGVVDPFDASITVFRAIPYAAPPLGQNRFRAPQPVVPWDGVRVCDKFSDVNIQLPPPAKYPDTLAGWPQSEDVLYLNVWVPGEDTERHEPGPYPVFFWMHGGGYREGGNPDKNFDGTGLAQKGVIVVVPNFRLGLTGFLAHPDLTKEDPNGTSGNQGLLDCVQALEWIRDNIAQLGGDPRRVTIAGQSSGYAQSQILICSPLAKGLISGAIMQSGARTTRDPLVISGPASYRYLKDAEQEGIDILTELGVSSIQELRDYPDPLKFAQLSMKRDLKYFGPPPMFRPVMDGHLLTQPYTTSFDQGTVPNDIPVMTGMNSHEATVYIEPRFTVEDLRESVDQRFGGGEWSARFYNVYPPADDEIGRGPLDAWNLSAREYARHGLALWAQQYNQQCASPVYGYYFTHHPPQWKGHKTDWEKPKAPGFQLNKGPLYGAFHSAELAYVFNSVITSDTRPWTDRDRQVGETVSTLWANFIKYGNPNGRKPEDRPEETREAPEWPTLKQDPGHLMEIGQKYELVQTASEQGKTFWNEYYAAMNQAW